MPLSGGVCTSVSGLVRTVLSSATASQDCSPQTAAGCLTGLMDLEIHRLARLLWLRTAPLGIGSSKFIVVIVHGCIDD